jgi:hypothetical protein
MLGDEAIANSVGSQRIRQLRCSYHVLLGLDMVFTEGGRDVVVAVSHRLPGRPDLCENTKVDGRPHHPLQPLWIGPCPHKTSLRYVCVCVCVEGGGRGQRLFDENTDLCDIKTYVVMWHIGNSRGIYSHMAFCKGFERKCGLNISRRQNNNNNNNNNYTFPVRRLDVFRDDLMITR